MGEVLLVEGEIVLDGASRYVINVGSVGQPRDGDPRAAFCVWDQETGKIELTRVPYYVARTQDKITHQGLPAFLSIRLSAGR